jgi:hypothetical protein
MSRLQQSEDRKGIMAAVAAAIAAYIEEEKAVTPVAVQRSQVPVLSLWHASGREEIMRMRTLWQRRIVSK